MAQINKDYYEDLTPESLESLLDNLKAGRPVTPGPQNGRQASAPLGGPITLTDPELYRNELPDDAPPDYQLRSKAPLGKGRKPKVK
jgi:NADH-quinone oxidoreductase subunit E